MLSVLTDHRRRCMYRRALNTCHGASRGSRRFRRQSRPARRCWCCGVGGAGGHCCRPIRRWRPAAHRAGGRGVVRTGRHHGRAAQHGRVHSSRPAPGAAHAADLHEDHRSIWSGMPAWRRSRSASPSINPMHRRHVPVAPRVASTTGSTCSRRAHLFRDAAAGSSSHGVSDVGDERLSRTPYRAIFDSVAEFACAADLAGLTRPVRRRLRVPGSGAEHVRTSQATPPRRGRASKMASDCRRSPRDRRRSGSRRGTRPSG